MTTHDKNLTRALAILTTEVDESHVCFQAGYVIVRGQHLNPQVDDDRAVLEILMADKEFGFAVSTVELVAKELRALQQVWFDAADKLKGKVTTRDFACETDERMTDDQALSECHEAQRILNEHIANNFVVDFCAEKSGAFGFSYDPERYAGIEARTADAAA